MSPFSFSTSLQLTWGGGPIACGAFSHNLKTAYIHFRVLNRFYVFKFITYCETRGHPKIYMELEVQIHKLPKYTWNWRFKFINYQNIHGIGGSNS